MKRLTILVPAGQNNLTSVVGAYKFFLKANDHFRRRGKAPIFRVEVAGQADSEELYDGLFVIRPHILVHQVKETDLIIIPALAHHNLAGVVAENEAVVSWVAEQYGKGAEVASICTGAFLLAATGLLNGKVCSTHWNAAGQFRDMYPGVILETDRLITDEQGIYTNGGAFSFLHLMLYLIEKYYDRETAVFCAKVFQVDIDRNSQSPFIIFNGQKDHSDDIIRQAQTYIENNLSEKIPIEELAGRFALSRRNFDRRFLKATGNTPAEYQQRAKIETAKKALESGNRTIQEVMYDVGYTDVKAFREMFRKITGLTPLLYRHKYHKDFTGLPA